MAEKYIQLNADECVAWVHRLERFSERFSQKGDENNAKMMYVCSILMAKFSLDVQCQETGPFPIEPGDC